MSCSTRRPLPGCFSTAGRTPRDGGSASTGRTIAPVRCRGRSRQPARPHGQTWSRSLRRQARRTSQCTPPPPRSRCFLLRGDRSTWRLAKRATRRLRQVRSASAPTLACTHCAHLRCGRTRVHLRAATETATTVSNMRMAPPQVDVACTPMHALVWDRPTKGGTSMWVCASHTTTLVCVACAVCGTSVPCPPGLALGASPRCRPDAGAVRLSLVAHPVRSHTHPLTHPPQAKVDRVPATLAPTRAEWWRDVAHLIGQQCQQRPSRLCAAHVPNPASGRSTLQTCTRAPWRCA